MLRQLPVVASGALCAHAVKSKERIDCDCQSDENQMKVPVGVSRRETGTLGQDSWEDVLATARQSQ